MAWIAVYQSLPSHRKTLRLQALLGMRRPQLLGHLVLLWLWAVDNAQDGRLPELSGRELGAICDLSPKRAGEFISALEQAGFLDRDGQGLRFHQWEDYGGKLLESRRNAAERNRRYRERARNGTGNSTEEDTTQENTTLQDSTADAPAGTCAGAAALLPASDGDDDGLTGIEKMQKELRKLRVRLAVLPEEEHGET